MKIDSFKLKFHGNSSPMIWLPMNQHWLKLRLCAWSEPNHYLNKRGPTCSKQNLLQWRHNERDASQIGGAPIVSWTVGSGRDQRKHQSSASLAFVRGIHRWPVNSPHKRPVRRKMFPFDSVIMHLRDGMSAWRPESQILNHLLLAPHLCVSELCQHWFRYWLGCC